MCGIAGIYQRRGGLDESEIQAMTQALAHRGPDGSGVWLSPERTCALGHTRLAIVDLAGGAQPMASTDGRFQIVFNGEIYNFAEVRQELLALGAVFQSRSDTEVLLEAYRQWGVESLERLRGMFAFAIFDGRDGHLWIARDRTGIKPLYYTLLPDGVIFGSEIKSLLTCARVPRRVNHKAIADFLVLGYPLMPNTGFRDVMELEPGTWLRCDETGTSSGRYWSWRRRPANWDAVECEQVTEQVLGKSLKEHLVADVPIAAQLSGGIDSSLLVALLQRQMSERLKTFHVRFADAEFDESAYAQEVANHLGTDHQEIIIENGAAEFDLIETVIDQFDQPFGDSSAIPTYLVSREIRKHVKVVLGGDGGDEMFGGYPRFRFADWARTAGHLPHWALGAIGQVAGAVGRWSPRLARGARRFLHSARTQSSSRLIHLSSYIACDRLHEVFQEQWLNKLDGYRPGFDAAETIRDPGGEEFMEATVRYVLPGDYLRKVDVMTSAHGLEARVPFLGEHVLDHACTIPKTLLYNDYEKKRVLRALARRLLPPRVAGKQKAGFSIPLDSWLGAEGRRKIAAVLGEPRARIGALLRSDYRNDLLAGFATGAWNPVHATRFNVYQRVYFLWSLERWLQRWNPEL